MDEVSVAVRGQPAQPKRGPTVDGARHSSHAVKGSITMDDYYQVATRPLEVAGAPAPGEINVKSHGKIRNYVEYACKFLDENAGAAVTVKGAAKALCKTISVAEIIQRKLGLTQNVTLHYVKIVEIWAPKEEDSSSENLEVTRKIPSISITLSAGGSAPMVEASVPNAEARDVVVAAPQPPRPSTWDKRPRKKKSSKNPNARGPLRAKGGKPNSHAARK